MASAHVILKEIEQRLRMAVSREEKWYPTILKVICLLYARPTSKAQKRLFVTMKDFMFMQLQAMDHAPLSDAPELGGRKDGGKDKRPFKATIIYVLCAYTKDCICASSRGERERLRA